MLKDIHIEEEQCLLQALTFFYQNLLICGAPKYFQSCCKYRQTWKNICRLFYFLVQSLYVTSETEQECHQRVNALVASQVAERLKPKYLKQLESFKNMPEMLAIQSRSPADDPKCKS